MKTTKNMVAMFVTLLLLTGCMGGNTVKTARVETETLYISEDGSMTYRDRPIDREDVVIYPDGFGGERAAVKLSLEPLHPPFYRDTIVVVREADKGEDVNGNN